MSENDEDSNNPNEQSQPSKLARPSNLNQYFDKIQANPKFCQFQAKLKPNFKDKNTKWTYKTNSKRLCGWDWINNSKFKLQTKDDKTKITVSTKLIDQNISEVIYKTKPENSKQTKVSTSERMFEKDSESISQPTSKQNAQNKGGEGKDGDVDISLSTSYDNTRFNARIKERGQIDLKVTQTYDLATNALKAQVQYAWEHKKNTDLNKYSLELFYTTGLGRWVSEIVSNQDSTANQKQISRSYHKNETKVKAKISNHSDTQIKITSINHFGQLVNKQTQINNQSPVTAQNVSKQNIQPALNEQQILKTKLQLENKLMLSRKSNDEFNFKTSFNYEFVELKQSLKLQANINQKGFHGLEGKYLSKLWPKLALGCHFGVNWNSHSSQWHKKWEVIFQKQGLSYLGNVASSIGGKQVGIKISKQIRNDWKFELIAAAKRDALHINWPKFGAKISCNL